MYKPDLKDPSNSVRLYYMLISLKFEFLFELHKPMLKESIKSTTQLFCKLQLEKNQITLAVIAVSSDAECTPQWDRKNYLLATSY